MNQHTLTSARMCPCLPAPARSERGLTLMEILLVIVLIGLMSAFAIPKLTDAMRRQNVQSARVAFVAMYAQARATAIQRGTTDSLILSGNVLRIRAANPVTGFSEAVGNSVDLYSRYGVTVSSTNSPWTFDSRGLGPGTSQTSVTISKGPYSTTILMSAAGRVIQ